MKFIDSQQDPWRAAEPDAAAPAPRAHALLTPAQWLAVRDGWPADTPVGVTLPNDADIETIADDLPRLALVVVHFPKWVDGRAYSQARLMRVRYRYEGEIRATGEVVVDMLPLLRRTGVDAVQLRADQSIDAARRTLEFFDDHYQADVHEHRPWFLRRAEAAR